MSEIRLVPMSRELLAELERSIYDNGDARAIARELLAAWDAAPADPAEAAHQALCALSLYDRPHYPGVASSAVLRALGWEAS